MDLETTLKLSSSIGDAAFVADVVDVFLGTS